MTYDEFTPNELESQTSEPHHQPAVPEEVKGWNWAAFQLSWIWAICHKLYWPAFLCLLPYAAYVMPFILGAKGNEWAWQRKKWESIAAFKKTQRRWTIGGVTFLSVLGLFILTLFEFSSNMMKNWIVTEQVLIKLEESEYVQRRLGSEIEYDNKLLSPGFSGNINISGPAGEADISFPVSGSESDGTVYVEATKHMDKWTIETLIVEVKETQERIIVME